MSIFLNGGKKVNGIFANVNGETKKIVSAWVKKDGLPVKVFSSGMKPRFVCVGNSGSAFYSLDGETWVAMSGLDTSITYYGVTYGNGRFLCVGASGSSYYSTDGETWVAMSGLDASITYLSVTYGNGRFVCVGNSGSAFYSLDGETWVAMSGTSTSYNFKSVAYGNGKFVAVCSGSRIYYSTNGEKWSYKTVSSMLQGYAVTYGKGSFVAIGYSGVVAISTDGITWTYKNTAATSLLNDQYYKSITFGKGKFVIGRAKNSNTYYYGSYIYISEDGITWNEIDAHIVSAGLTYGKDRFVSVGRTGNNSSDVSLGKTQYSLDGETWVAMSGTDGVTWIRSVCYSIDGGYDNS